jgi:LysR family transcriptional regulator, glycine cleavage system transcriptional activator
MESSFDDDTQGTPTTAASARCAARALVPVRRSPPMHALEAFEAAARLGTFAAAADELCVTHSAVSHRIRLLEEHVGVALFVRVHRQVVLTPDGERFLVGVREAMRHLAQAATSVGRVPRSRLRITSSPALASELLIPHLHEFMAQREDLQIEIDTSVRIVDLAEEEFDLGLRFGVGPWPGLASERLLEERVVALASPDYAATFGTTRSVAMLAQANLIHSSAFSWAHWFKSIGGPVASLAADGLTLPEVRVALDAAAHGLGVVLANQLGSLELRRQRRLVPFVPAFVDLRRHYYAVHRPDGPRRAAIEAFLEWLRPIVRVAGSTFVGTHASA